MASGPFQCAPVLSNKKKNNAKDNVIVDNDDKEDDWG